MSSYFLAPALATLLAEVNAVFLKRDKASDGWIGDPSHAARKSDHNPCWSCTGRSDGIVRALDIDISPDGRPDLDLRKLVLEATIGDPRVWYDISNDVIYSRTAGFAPKVYGGTNGHYAHVHVSLIGANGMSGDPSNFDTRPWGLLPSKPAPPKITRLPLVKLDGIRTAYRHPTRAVRPAQVMRVQAALNDVVSAGIRVDGIYGPGTRAAVKRWQRSLGREGASVNGLLGEHTLARLGANLFRTHA